MTGYKSKKAAAQAKLEDDDTQVYQTELTKLLMESYDQGVADALVEIKAAQDKMAQPAQEPVEFFDWYDNAHWGNEDFKEGCHRAWNAAIKYTTPPQRPWVGLTDEEAQWLYDNCRTPNNLIEMVEAKLKEKNNAML